jgi:rare lipoprotein A
MRIQKLLLVNLLLLNSFSFTSASESGNATFYNKKMKGHHTSDGGKYHPDSLTCAHLKYPLGTLLKVRNPKNEQEVIVKVTDRGPHNRRLIIDLSYRAAKELDIVRSGIATVEVEVFQQDSVSIK